MTPGRPFTKGCGGAIAVWLALVGAYAYVAWGRVHEPFPVAIIAILGGTFAAMLLSSIIGFFVGGRDRAAIRRAMALDAPRDGQIEAASGPIRALGAPLEAPFTGQPCVAYDYDVKRPDQGQSEFAGVALTPCAIDTARGPVRVLGWSMLDEFPAASVDRLDLGRGERYLSGAPLEPLGFTSVLSTLRDLVTDDDGTVRKDFRIGGAVVNLEGRQIVERAIPVGMVVTLLGRWSDARGGIAPAGLASMNRLFAGDLASAKRQVGGNVVRTFAVALVFFLVLHAILATIYIAAPNPSRAERAGSVWDERDCDKQKAMLAAGADPNERGTDAWTPLMNAARMDDPACVSNLVAAGAQLEAADKFSDTALAQAVVAGRDDNVKVLLAAGAKDFRVTAANGRPLSDDAPPLAAVRDYIAAVHAGDFDTMARLMAHASVRRMEDHKEDLPMWQSLRPKVFVVEEGWMTDDAATLSVRGATPRGDQRVWYHVVRQPDGWQIAREWFPPR